MKKILLTITTIAALVSCSKDETIVNNREVIGFNNVFVDNTTKATDPSFSNTNLFTSFNVWGSVKAQDNSYVAVFANDNVSGTGIGDSNVWNCTTKTQYWIPSAYYQFAAVVNADTYTTGNNVGKDVVTIGTNKLPATITYTADDQKDLLYAISSVYQGKKTGNDLVGFTFDHLLSKAIFTVTGTKPTNPNAGVSGNSDMIDNYTYHVHSIKIINASPSGTVDVPKIAVGSDYTWSPVRTNPREVSFGNIEGSFDNNPKECTDAKLLVPTNFTDSDKLKISFTVDIYYDSKIITSHNYTPSLTVQLKSGKYYNFTIGVGIGTAIQFKVNEVDGWDPADGIETPVASI